MLMAEGQSCLPPAPSLCFGLPHHSCPFLVYQKAKDHIESSDFHRGGEDITAGVGKTALDPSVGHRMGLSTSSALWTLFSW